MDNYWRTTEDDIIGAWIKLNFVGAYRLTKMMVYGFFDSAKDISLAFSNGVQMNFTLNNAANWQTIDLEGIGNDIITIYANFSVISVYPDHHVYQKYIQFRELKVFG